MKHSNISCLNVANGFPENRSTFFRKAVSKQNASVIENPEGDEGTGIDENIDNSVTLTGREGKFQEVDTIHKKYSQRPDTLENMCLAQFATSYHSIKKSSDGTEWDKNESKAKGSLFIFEDKDHKNPLPKYIRLTSGGIMALKSRPVILRIHSAKKKEYKEGIYSELLLFKHWRKEEDLRSEFEEDCEAMFTKYEEEIRGNKNAIYPNAPMIDLMMELLESNENMKPSHLYETIDEQAQQEDCDDDEEINETNPIDTS